MTLKHQFPSTVSSSCSWHQLWVRD
jgi:hypothetical protein